MIIVKTKEQFIKALDSFTDEIVLDTETSGLDVWHTAHACGIGICTSNEETFYFPYRHKQKVPPIFQINGEELMDNPENLPIASLELLTERLKQCKTIIGHNLKFDLAVMYKEGFQVSDNQRIEDTLCIGRMLYPVKGQSLSLENLAIKVLKDPNAGKWKVEFDTYLKKNGIKEHYDWGDIDVVGEYCCNDTLTTWKIRQLATQRVIETQQTRIWDQECKLLQVLWQIERDGMFIDLEYCKRKIPLLESRVKELEELICEVFGYSFDVMSTSQLDKAMATIGIFSPLKTEKGSEKWNIEVLLGIDNPVAKLVLQYREAYKMLNTYLIPFAKWNTGYIHPNFKPHGTATGRMSCTQPNLQNVMTKPIDVAGEKVDEKVQAIFKTMSKSSSVSSRWIARITKFEEKDSTVAVKRMFVAPPGYSMYCIDFSQMEMRVFSDFVGDPEVLDQLESHNFDFHSFVATQVWGSDESDPNWKFYRSIAKAINFGLIYGIGVAKLSIQIQKSLEEATKYKENYFEQFPSAKKFMDNVKRKIIREGVVYNRFDRRYTIPADKAYTGVNYLVQGTSADYVKNRMIAIWEYLKPYKTRMVAQIHDEIVFYVHKDEEKWIVPEVKAIMEERLLKVLLPTDVSKCFPSWSEKGAPCPNCLEKKEENHICVGTDTKKKKPRRATAANGNNII